MESDKVVEKHVIPIIDLQAFGDSKSYQKLREACEQWGCFRLINHGISPILMSDMKTVATSLFDLPVEIKKRNVDEPRGYVARSPKNPFLEALSFHELGSPEDLRRFCHQLDFSSHQREILENYGKAVQDITTDIGRKLAKSIGLDDYDLFREWSFLFKLNKYHFTPETVGLSGIPIHTDPGFLTILQDDENVGGLEVLNNSTGEFQEVDPLPGALLLNLGDTATAWSNGRYHNVKHRVKCKEGNSRYSIASFLFVSKKKAIEAPPELVDDEHPRLFAPFTFEDFMKLRSDTLLGGEALELLRAPISRNSSLIR